MLLGNGQFDYVLNITAGFLLNDQPFLKVLGHLKATRIIVRPYQVATQRGQMDQEWCSRNLVRSF
jgi:hypothetical protein